LREGEFVVLDAFLIFVILNFLAFKVSSIEEHNSTILRHDYRHNVGWVLRKLEVGILITKFEDLPLVVAFSKELSALISGFVVKVEFSDSPRFIASILIKC
jgi:hypothetical protein